MSTEQTMAEAPGMPIMCPACGTSEIHSRGGKRWVEFACHNTAKWVSDRKAKNAAWRWDEMCERCYMPAVELRKALLMMLNAATFDKTCGESCRACDQDYYGNHAPDCSYRLAVEAAEAALSFWNVDAAPAAVLAHNSGQETQRAAKLHGLLATALGYAGHAAGCNYPHGAEYGCKCGWLETEAEIAAALALLPPGMLAEAGGEGEA